MMSVDALQVKAYAKINITLDVLHKRADGYHEVSMIMQAIDLHDTVSLKKQNGDITVEANIPALACDDSNLACRAARLVKENCHIAEGVHIVLDKQIPLAAGLAGGSSNAAAVLKGMNQLWQLGLSQAELEALGASLGSDIPFCLRGGTMLATGRGEILTPLPAMPCCYVVLAKPGICVSTARVYGRYRSAEQVVHPDTQGVIAGLERQDLPAVTQRLCNVLESVTVTEYPLIDELKQSMKRYGVMNSLMSGSGPTVFGLTPDLERANYVADRLGSQFKDKADIRVAKTLARVE
ncbi:4-(cytidine 5'-diphospho)-2-C-methyl-D-erythritol kinase [Propionispora vibrioides]|uniref:4-diphosphocytidyl-2-C-methyl-D-erythritol kinase n=1 Tax=Propionispora vibrioides TaxID=112903 RepID=A0A1H8PXC6_9FIRM|nr:4-diphosphocytidyl-2-C-methyl-D-erythritol kinase [Propionispora vibrioides]